MALSVFSLKPQPMNNSETELHFGHYLGRIIEIKKSFFLEHTRMADSVTLLHNLMVVFQETTTCGYEFSKNFVSKVYGHQSFTKYLRQILVFMKIAHYGKSSISIFQELFASIDKILILG